MSSTHRHLDEPELLQAALDASALELRRELAECAECARRARAFDAFVGQLRGALADAPAPALAARVLAATTREDLGWRGDARVVWNFTRERLRSSPLARVAAVILLMHLAALPVLAWIVLRAPRPAPYINTGIVLPQAPVFPLGEREPERRPELAEPAAEPRLVESDGAEVERGDPRDARAARRAEALVLSSSAAPRCEGSAAPRAALARLLWARGRTLAGAALDAETEGWLAEPRADETEGALALELALDRLALLGRRAQGLDAQLAALLGRARPSALALLALERAERYGALDPEQIHTLRQCEVARRGVEGPLRSGAGAPFDAQWLGELAGVLAEQAPDPDGVLAAWLAFAR